METIDSATVDKLVQRLTTLMNAQVEEAHTYVADLQKQLAEQRAKSSQQDAALFAALAQAQGKFQPIPKNRKATIRPRDQSKAPYEFRYADLESIITATRPALTEQGLALVQLLEVTNNDATIVTRLVHTGGGEFVSRMSISHPRQYDDPKAFGALVSYMRRYVVTCILGVAADDDIDQDGSEVERKRGDADRVQQPKGRRSNKPAEDAPTRAAPAPSSGQARVGECTTGEVAYLTNKAAKIGAAMDEVLSLLGIDLPETLDGITRDQFDTIKAELLSRGA